MLKLCLRVKTSMRIGKFQAYQLTETPDEYRILVNHWKRDSIRWDIYDSDESTHTPEHILYGLNAWDDYYEVGLELRLRAELLTGRDINPDNISISYRQTTPPG